MTRYFSFEELFSFVNRISSEEQAVQAIKVIDRQKCLCKADRLELEQVVLEKYYFYQENV